MTTIAHCTSVDEAALLRSLLEGSGVRAFIPDELSAQNVPTYIVGGLSQLRLQVEDEDAPRAREVLKQSGRADVF